MEKEKENDSEEVIYIRVDPKLKELVKEKCERAGIKSFNTIGSLLLRRWAEGKITVEV